MEKQVLEQTLQQVLEQPISKNSSPTTSQQDAVRKEDKKSPEREQVQSWHDAQPCIRRLISFNLSAGISSLQHLVMQHRSGGKLVLSRSAHATREAASMF